MRIPLGQSFGSVLEEKRPGCYVLRTEVWFKVGKYRECLYVCMRVHVVWLELYKSHDTTRDSKNLNKLSLGTFH